MKARQKTATSPTSPRPSWTRWAFWGVGGLGTLCLFVMIGVGLWFQNSLNQFKTLEAKTRTAYKSLNEQYSFAVAEGHIPVSGRLEAYFRIRDGVINSIPAEVDSLTASFLRNGSVRRFDLLRVFSAEMDSIQRAAQKHVAGLRAEHMSLNEYLWLHGMVVREIFRNSDPRREELETVVKNLDRVFASSSWIEAGGFNAESFAQGLELQYGDVAALSPEALAPMDLGRSAACVIDVLAANHSRAVRERDEDNSGS